jgi:thiamine-phosphate pyrophosphorylase
MRFSFTTAAERALDSASGWRNRADCNELEAVALLVGLLAEPECRAAAMLAKLAVDTAAIRVQWPNLEKWAPSGKEQPRRRPLSSDVLCSLHIAADRLFFLPQPLELATEHVLLGLAAADNDVSVWLRGRGVDPDAIEAEIRRLYGCARAEGRGARDEGLASGERQLPADKSGQWSVVSGQFSEREAAELAPRVSVSKSETQTTETTHSLQTTALRIIDAAANRGREGLRVIEDYVRFALDDQNLTGLCKQFRHDLTDSLSKISPAGRVTMRETEADVGTVLTTSSERRRGDLAEVVRANFARLQESLRSLEEFGKILSADDAETFKQLRYRAYTLEKAVETTRGSIERLAAARLYVLIDGRPSVEEFDRLVCTLINAGVDVLQLRDKQLDDRTLLDRARRLRELTAGASTLCIINDRSDVAALAHADGVHVGQEEVSVKDARRIVGPEALVGVSAHSIEQSRQAVLDGANYLGVGPTFPSGTKQFERFPGVELLRAVSAEIRLPAFAIGGITLKNVAEVLRVGVSRIAVSGAILSADDPGAAAKELLKTLNKFAKISGN